jgi:[acyl-carrier-protein] S-malonyltransferase
MARDPIALVFPGQGSQRPGMAAWWRDHPAFARWSQADEILGRDVTRLGLDASAGELREPASCQIALFVHGAVVLDAWRGAGGEQPVAVAGHSLGEYNALLAAGVLDFADALRLVEARARHTQEAAEAAPGTMVACLGFEVEDVQAACAEVGAHVANDNAPGQLVVAGSSEVLARLKDALDGGKGRIVDLDVGAAYHSPHMQAAIEPFAKALADARFADAQVPVVANVDAQPHSAAADWPELLREQLTTPVRWRETVGTFAILGVGEVVELCATPVLCGLVKRTDRTIARRAVATPEEL